MQLAHQKRSITPVTPLSYLCHTLVISRFIPPLFSFHIPVILLSHPCHTPVIPLSYSSHTRAIIRVPGDGTPHKAALPSSL